MAREKKTIYTCSGPMQFFSNVFGMRLAQRMDVDSTGEKAELYIYFWKLWWNSNIPQASTICEQKNNTSFSHSFLTQYLLNKSLMKLTLLYVTIAYYFDIQMLKCLLLRLHPNMGKYFNSLCTKQLFYAVLILWENISKEFSCKG